MKEQGRKKDRDANLADAMNNLEEIQSTIAFYGVYMVAYGASRGETHEWQFYGDDEKMLLQYWPDLVYGRPQAFSIGDTKESIHNVAKALLTTVPLCIDQTDSKAVIAYRVGVMKLAESLTGQNAIEADKDTERKMFGVD